MLPGIRGWEKKIDFKGQKGTFMGNGKILYHEYDDYIIEYICKIHRIVLKRVNFVV